MRKRISQATGLSVALLFGMIPLAGRAAPKPFSIVVMPDTQNYADARKKPDGTRAIPDYSRHFYGQTKWIKENATKLNIAMVAHVGDIVQTDHPDEWQIADKAFKALEGAVPYVLSQGNHDLTVGPKQERQTRMNEFFPPSRFKNAPWYAGHYGDGNENSYARFEAGGMRFLLLSLEFAPRDEVLTWADQVIARHPADRAIILTHCYLNDGRRIANPGMGYQWTGNSAEQVWEKLAGQHSNIFLVLSGHLVSCRLSSTGKGSNTVHQVQSDYQHLPEGGGGYLTVMRFLPAENRIDVTTYSPTLDRSLTTDVDTFSLPYTMRGSR